MSADASDTWHNAMGIETSWSAMAGQGLQIIQSSNPKINYHTATSYTNCWSQRELTAYSFQQLKTIPNRPCMPARPTAPVRSIESIALLAPSIESCNLNSQSVPLNIISSHRDATHTFTKLQRKFDPLQMSTRMRRIRETMQWKWKRAGGRRQGGGCK